LCSDAGCKNQHQYDHDDSPTYSAPSSPIEITVEFGSGTLEGKLARDTLYLGDIAAPNIEFYEVTNQRGIFNEGEFDGIFGLSKPFDSQYGTQKSAFDVMVERGIFAKNIFAFSLGRGSSSAYLTLGGYNQDELASEIQWFKVIHPSYWMIELDKVYLGDEDTKLCNNNCAAIIDSGTSLLTAPGTDLQVMTRKHFICLS
jgi:Eukaryotic aspartyl protease.